MTAETTGARVPLLTLSDVYKTFALEQSLVSRMLRGATRVIALDHIDVQLDAGEVLGLVGESGSGKSTLAYAMMRLTDIDSGVIRFRGGDITRAGRAELRPFRKAVQMVFQDTQSSLNPRKTVEQTLDDVLRLRGVADAERASHAADVLARVGLDGQYLCRYPHQVSGGQRQRVGIARALAMGPELLIADEPISSLDVSLQAQLLRLLTQLREELGLGMVLISHDLAVVSHVCDRVAVMYAGRIVETGTVDEVFRTPAHPYTQTLLAAVPTGLARRAPASSALAEEPTELWSRQPGCRFAARCQQANPICRQDAPRMVSVSARHHAECHLLGAPHAKRGDVRDVAGIDVDMAHRRDHIT
jgi:oligopeptide/dipeptide ABC transporter ATP-binding protein